MSNFAFIDSQNINLGIKQQDWSLNFGKFRQYLKDKLDVSKAFLFIGFLPENQALYTNLQKQNYILIFKPTLKLPDKTVKGNVDAELVLQAMIEYDNYDGAVIATGDGDFHCLIDYLSKQKKLERLIIPDKHKYSSLLRKFGSKTLFLNGLRDKLKYEAPRTKKRGIN